MVEKIATSSATFSVFFPIFSLTRACFFLPVKIRSTGQTTTVTWSWLYYFISVSSFSCTMVWIIFGLGKSYAIEDVYNIRLSKLSGMFITILDDSYLLFTFTLATLITPITFKHFCTYLKCLDKADHILKHPAVGEKKKCFIILSLTLFLTIFVLALDMAMWWNYVFSKHISLGLYLLYNLPFYHTYFLVMVIEMNYWYFVQMVNVRLVKLNKNLVENYKKYKLDCRKPKCRTKTSSNVYVLQEPSIDSFATNISNLVKVYELLFDTSGFINKFFGLNILLVVIGCFVHLLVTPYDLYLELKFKDYTFILPQICWMVSHVLRLVLIVEPCHKATQEMRLASSLVCQFLSLDLSKELRSQLDMLATQLFHCPIQYTAYDLVVLDRSLLTKVTGGVTTYLVILFQFEN